jgi:MOSC domain-containing protein YiiM
MPSATAALHVGPYAFTGTDATRTFAQLGGLWRMHVHGLAEVPPDARATAMAIAARLADRTATSVDVGPDGDPADALDAAGAAAAAHLGGAWTTEEAELELDAAWLGLRAVAEALRAAGTFGPTTSGTVVQLNVSGGGVPKLPVERAEVGWSGLEGDRQAARVHHGRPWQALCVWSAEVIDRFAEMGNPIGYGSAGENVTVRGLPWDRVRPGAHLRIGTVECQVSAYSLPCSKNARWFLDGDSTVMHHERGPVSRVYATVTAPGAVAQGDEVVLEP